MPYLNRIATERPATTRDGRLVHSIVVDEHRDDAAPFYLLDLNTHRLRPFHVGAHYPITGTLQFTPTGQLAFTDVGSGVPLSITDLSGRHEVSVPAMDNLLDFADLSSTGDQAVFVGETPGSTVGILLYHKGRYSTVSPGVYDAETPTFAHSGRLIAYAAFRREHRLNPVYGINVLDLAHHRTHRLTSMRTSSDWSPIWSPDDRYLAFVRSVPREECHMGAGEVWVMWAGGAEACRIGGLGVNVGWTA